MIREVDGEMLESEWVRVRQSYSEYEPVLVDIEVTVEAGQSHQTCKQRMLRIPPMVLYFYTGILISRSQSHITRFRM